METFKYQEGNPPMMWPNFGLLRRQTINVLHSGATLHPIRAEKQVSQAEISFSKRIQRKFPSKDFFGVASEFLGSLWNERPL